jgi:NAD-dependent DNA ligase
MSYREDKLQIQREADSSNGDDGNLILKGVKVYIDGYLEGTTDTEIKKVIVQCGGRVVCVASKLESW